MQRILMGWGALAGLVCWPLPSLGQEPGVQMSRDSVVKCADAGIAECQYRLGQMTEAGQGVQQDPATARKLYELAYRNGYTAAGDAILRLARGDASPAASAASSTASAVPAVASAADAAAAAETADTTAAAATQQSLPVVTFFPDGRPGGVGPVFLGQSEPDMRRALPGTQCERVEGGYRMCSGTLGSGPDGTELMAAFQRSQARMVIAMLPSGCDRATSSLSARHPRANPTVTKLMAAKILSGIARDLPPDMQIAAWNSPGKWAAFTLCSPEDGSGMVLLTQGDAMPR